MATLFLVYAIAGLLLFLLVSYSGTNYADYGTTELLVFLACLIFWPIALAEVFIRLAVKQIKRSQ